MKTTVEIADDLLARCRRVADRQGTTLRALVEEGLRLALKARAASEVRELRLPTFGDGGLTERYQSDGLHRAILDSYAGSLAEERLDPAAARSVHDRP